VVAPLLSAEGLVRVYDGRTVLDVERLDLEAGQALAVVGPNGAGKSTLFRLLLLLERADAGIIRLGGETVVAGGRRPRLRLAGVFQKPILFTGTVRDNVGYGLRARGVARRERDRRVDEALASLDLIAYADAPAATLSGGEAQRVALARALAVDPDVLLLDEPTANLDVSARRRFRRDLEAVALRRARGLLLITHDAGEAFGLAERIVVLDHGRIIQEETPERIMLRPASPFVAELTGAELLLHGTVERVEDGLCAVSIGEGLRLWAATAADTVVRPGHGAVVAYRPEDIFLTADDERVETSAVNRLPVAVEAVVPAGSLVRVLLRCTATPQVVLTALLTRRSTEALHLEKGARLAAHLKATALHAWQRGT
jgi:ABC-type sulfate/molybdate transport systems ATPase subunit